jgi:hypothetical protein
MSSLRKWVSVFMKWEDLQIAKTIDFLFYLIHEKKFHDTKPFSTSLLTMAKTFKCLYMTSSRDWFINYDIFI